MRSTGRNDTVLGRAFAVLDAFRGERRPLSLADITRSTGLPKTTTHRMLRELVKLGAVSRWGDRYVVGVSMWELGGHALPQRLRELAVPYLEDLRRLTDGVVHLGVLQGTDVLYLEKIAGHRSVDIPTRLGGRMPAYCTALGKVLLAAVPEAEAARRLPATLTKRTDATIVDRAELAAAVARARSEGVAFDRQESYEGISCVAAAISPPPLLPAAISVSARTDEVDLDAIAPAVRDVGLAVGRALADAIRSAAVSGRVY